MSRRWPLGPARMAGGFVGWGSVGREDVAEEIEVVVGSEGSSMASMACLDFGAVR
jgi:hypothetical protein